MTYGNEESYDADMGNYMFYCRVTDAAGNRVTSDHVKVSYRPYFSKEPEDVNFDFNKQWYCTLETEVEDGVEPYSYQWYTIDEDTGHIVFLADGYHDYYTFTPHDELDSGETYGRFYCEVMDANGYTATSRTARIYRADPLVCSGPYDVKMGDQPVTLTVKISGGVPPFEKIWYDRYGRVLSSEANSERTAEYKASELGDYSVYIKDELANIYTAEAEVSMKPLTIVRQPKGGQLPDRGTVTLSIRVFDGVAPYTYVQIGRAHV